MEGRLLLPSHRSSTLFPFLGPGRTTTTTTTTTAAAATARGECAPLLAACARPPSQTLVRIPLCLRTGTFHSLRLPLCRCSDDRGRSSSAPRPPEFASQDAWQWSSTTQELVAYGILLAGVPIVPYLPRFEWSGPLYFLTLAVWSLYVGSHRSLGSKPPQKLSVRQGLIAPFIFSFSLFGFYCLLRFFPSLDLKVFLSAYLGLVGAFSVSRNLVEPVRRLIPKANSMVWRIEIPEWLLQEDGQPVQLTLTAADLISFSVGIIVAVASKQSGAPFTLNNFIAVCIVTELLQLLSLGSFTTAAVLLSGLLLYDVFWVFGSSQIFGDNVMVTVATSKAFDGPVKLIFPQWKGNPANPYSILGLGDIAAPGLLISLMLRFDQSRSKQDSTIDIPDSELEEAYSIGSIPNLKPDKTYFITCMASYIIGLGLTIVANSVSGAAQPALLYLVPALLSGVFFIALSRSEAPLLFSFKDEMYIKPATVKGVEKE